MKIQEVKELRKAEREGTLRCSSFFEQAGIKGDKDIRKLMYGLNSLICNLMTSKNDTTPILEILRNPNSPLHIIYGEECTAENPFIFDFVLGQGLRGVMFKADSLFDCNGTEKKNKYRQLYAKFVKPNFCFSNCFDMAREIQGFTSKYPIQIISGILSNDNSRDSINSLHSVLKIRKNVADVDSMNLIVDFNHNLCMDERSYLTIFDFEPLSQTFGEQIELYKSLITEETKKGTFDHMYYNFATKDYLDYLSNPKRQQTENLSADLLEELLHTIAHNETLPHSQMDEKPPFTKR